MFFKKKSFNKPKPPVKKVTKKWEPTIDLSNIDKKKTVEPKQKVEIKTEKMPVGTYSKDFLNGFNKLTRTHRPFDVWRDFVIMFACAISNPLDKFHYKDREERYLSIIHRYGKDEQMIFPKLAAYTTMALDANPEQDFLGKMFMDLGLGNSSAGQFFTPYSVCQLMADVVTSDLDNNLQATGITGPEKVNFKEEAKYVVSVLNEGVRDASQFAVYLTDEEFNVLATKTVESLAAQSSVNVEISYTPSIEMAGSELTVYGVVGYDSDEEQDDNRTKTAVVTKVNGSSYPVATGLTGNREGAAIKLAWSAPSLSKPVAEVVTDGFEDYDPFTIDGFGAWTVADVDGGNTYVFGESQSWPNAGQPQAFMIFDMNSEHIAGLGVDERFMMDNSHGSKLAVCWSSDPQTTDLGHNDDWLISPRLADGGQTVSFQAKAYDSSFTESIEVYYSTTGNAIEDFTNNLAKVSSVPADTWATYTYDLPANTTYFAIRCVSANAFLLGIDNVVYKPQPVLPEGLAVESYNVYRNGELLDNTAATEFTDNAPSDGDNVYAVSVVYNMGESILSDPCTVGTSGIENNSMDNIRVYEENGTIVIRGAEGKRATVSDMSGIVLHNDICSDVTVISVSRGVYVVKVNGKAIKVIVR